MTRDRSHAALASYAHALVPRSLAEVAPGLATLLHYPRPYLRSDVIAGVTVGAVAVPSSLAMAELAGLPVVYGALRDVPAARGLRAARDITPTRDRAGLDARGTDRSDRGAAGDGRGEVDPARYLAIATALALAMGACSSWRRARLGFVADFFGKPVLLGYINGVALIVISSQLGKLLGISVDADDFFPIIWDVLSNLGDANGPTVLLSVGLLAAAIVARRVLPVLPPSLVVLALGLVVAALVDLEITGSRSSARSRAACPPLRCPESEQATSSISCFPRRHLPSSPSRTSIATVRTFAQKHGYEVDANRELDRDRRRQSDRRADRGVPRLLLQLPVRRQRLRAARGRRAPSSSPRPSSGSSSSSRCP